MNSTVAWIKEIQSGIKSKLAYLDEPDAFFPQLFMSTHAPGDKKAEKYIERQGIKATSLFEKAVAAEAPLLGIDHLGTWNLTIQSDVPDGT
jgi:hypothetical protein